MRGFWMFINSVFCLLMSGVLVASSLAEQGDQKAGKVIYDKICATCHGTTGKGDGPAAAVLPTKPRNHTDGQYMNILTDDYVFKIIKEGGAAVGKAQFMPAWGAQIKDSEIWNVVAYIRSLAVPPYEPTTSASPSTQEKPAAAAEPQAQKKTK
ncbi:MAG: cytochrome c [Candidatus Binatia bacterium]